MNKPSFITEDSVVAEGLSHIPVQHTLADQNELREAFRKIWRRRRLIALTIVVFMILFLIALFEVTSRYTATVMIIIDPRSTKVVNVEAVMAGGAQDAEAVLSEAEILASTQLVGKMVDKLALQNVPEFNVALKPPTLLQKINPINLLPDSVIEIFTPEKLPLTEEQAREMLRQRVIDSVIRSHLKVVARPRTRILNISIESESPGRAVQMANTLADLYVVDQLDAKFEATQRVTTWLNDRLTDLRKKVDESDHAVEAYRASAGLIESYKASSSLMGNKGVTLTQQQLADLSTQLTVARTERSAAESKLHQVKEAVASPGGELSVAEVLDSQLIQHLREQELFAEKSITELGVQYGERHPKMISARAQLDDIHEKIKVEVNKIIIALNNAAANARAREAAITSQMDDLKRQLTSTSSAEVHLRDLQMEADSNRGLMEGFLARFKETSAQEAGGIQTPDSRIISRAQLPEKPSFPKVVPFTAIAFVFSTVLGIILAFIAEHLDRGFRSGVQFEHETGTPVLAMIPLVDETNGRAADYLVDRPMSAYAEAVRSVYTSLLLTHSNKPVKSVVISSSTPGEGKSTLAISLTRMVAQSGQRAILIEADLRRPSIHHQLGIERSIGLAEVLIGSVTLDDALYRDPKTSADILLAGKETLNPSKLLASHQMDELLTQLAPLYDLIVIDTAPVLAVSDGLLLAHKADGTIYSCRWAVTSRETAALGLKELRDANAKIVGAVISAVNTKVSQSYGYADTSYHYYAKKYYTE